MLCRLLTAGAAICALTLFGFYGQADAATRLMLKASSSPTILAADEENPEVRISSILKPPMLFQADPAPQLQATSRKPVWR